MRFKVGDRVKLIDEAGEGVVTALLGDRCEVLFEHGFSQVHAESELIAAAPIALDLAKVLPDLKGDLPLKPIKKPAAVSTSELLEVDLHLEALVDFPRRIQPAEALEMQKSAARNALARCRSRKIGRLVLIHGVGEGVLKSALTDWLRRQEGLEFYDASYALYGRGATEVRIFRF